VSALNVVPAAQTGEPNELKRNDWEGEHPLSEPEVTLYYKNVLADRIGPEHGISDAQLDELTGPTAEAVTKVNAARDAGQTPYRDLPYRDDYRDQVRAVAAEIAGCENFVVLGIGGSALGNIALQTALNPYLYNLDASQRTRTAPDGTQVTLPRLFVFDNIDPDQFGNFLEWIMPQLDRTVFNVISKSGQTAETAAQLLIVRKLLADRLGPAALRDHLVVTTDAKRGIFRPFADAQNLRSLLVPDGVGGRFSVLSPVGLLSAAVCGIDIDALAAGAAAMDARVKTPTLRDNPAALIAAIHWHYYQRGKPIHVMMPYAYALKGLSDWYRQLWAESLGKAHALDASEVHVGPTPVKALGTTDQHSQVQLYREGPNDKVFTFLHLEHFDRQDTVVMGPADGPLAQLDYLAGQTMARLFDSEKTATEYALMTDQRPCLTVRFDRVCPETVGQFFYLYEVATSITGRLFNINTYDQPAVELGKQATFALMGRRSDEYVDLAAKIDAKMRFDPAFCV